MEKGHTEVRKIQALIKATLSQVEQFPMQKADYEQIRKLIIRIAYNAMLVGFNSSEKNGNHLER